MKQQLSDFKLFKRTLFLVGLVSIFSFSAYAQNNFTVTGTVSDEYDVPLPGATVVEKGTTNGVSTDFDGNYSISVANQNSVLVISYIGYAAQEIAVFGKSEINTSLEPSASSLDEVIVVGYGAVKKKDLTGSVAQVDAAELSNQSVNSVTDVLRGNVAGLNIGFSASPKGTSQIQIRGNNSLTAGTSPLIVVDGILYTGDLSDINPADIDKLDVLKDASSAAVYGARGAGGVILVTTKRGSSDKPVVTINTSVGFASEQNPVRPYSPNGYADWRVDVFKSSRGQLASENPGIFDNPNNLPDGVSVDQWLAYTGAQGDPTSAWLTRIGFQDVEVQNYLAGKSIDWYDKIMQTGFRNEQNVSISGRNGGLNYYWSIGRTSNEGIIVGEKFEALRSRLNLDAKVNDWLTVGMNTQFAKRNEGFIPADQNQVFSSSPWGSEFNDEGTLLRISPQDDPGAGASSAFLRPTYDDLVDLEHTFNSRVYAKVQLPLGFSYELGFTNRLDIEEYFVHASSLNPNNVVGRAQRWNRKQKEYQLDNIIRWDKTINKHTFGLTALFYAEKFETYTTIANANTFEPSDALGFSNLQAGTNQNVFTDDEETTGDAIMTRFNYNYDSRYNLSLTMRRDGYSAFGLNNKRAYFPSVGGAWTVSEENFFKSDFVTFLKLRASYGENGNRGFGSARGITTSPNPGGFRSFNNERGLGAYAQLSELSGGNYLNVDGGTVVPVPTFNNNTIANPDLRWERTKAVNLGLDFSFAGGIVEGSIDAYRNVTTDLIVRRQLPSVIGFNEVFTNLGEVQNKGLEFVVSTQNYNRENFSWNTSFNFSLNRNKINALYGDLDENGNELDDLTTQRFIGQATDVIWDYEVLGVWQSNEASEAAELGFEPGDFKLRDVNGDGIFTDDDKVFVGNRSPQFNMGMSNRFSFLKNFDFSFEWYARLGQKRVFNESKNRNGFVDRVNSPQTPYWTPDNPLNDYARLFSNDGPGFNVYRSSSFVRLSNITLAYRLPKSILSKLSMSSARIYANVRNAAVWAPDWDFYDPEGSNVNGASRGSDGLFDANGREPTPRFITLGVDISL
ncbi:SusC/RagA family TonB-linked outer membrane protein [Zobellia laminariae]|uniref:SusC/RagA family TonB-linked outer membrane protein n=1 Tax=Zobellia laminariae TaxID=248906 RepID=UPI0012D970D9|nr:SusC/RagA family TonB-linked outer membrane protein [Zobellia laminariae]